MFVATSAQNLWLRQWIYGHREDINTITFILKKCGIVRNRYEILFPWFLCQRDLYIITLHSEYRINSSLLKRHFLLFSRFRCHNVWKFFHRFRKSSASNMSLDNKETNFSSQGYSMWCSGLRVCIWWEDFKFDVSLKIKQRLMEEELNLSTD